MKKILTASVFIICSSGVFANDYVCNRDAPSSTSIALRMSTNFLSDNSDTLTCNDRIVDNSIYAKDGEDYVKLKYLVWDKSKAYLDLGSGNDIFEISPGTPEDVANNVENGVFQNAIVNWWPGDDTVIISWFNSYQVAIVGNCKDSCTITYNGSASDRQFENNTLENIEHIKFDDKIVNFLDLDSWFKYTIPLTGKLIVNYESSTNPWPINKLDLNENGSNDVIAETDMWNIKSANWTWKIYYNTGLNRFTFDVDLNNIVSVNNAWTYGYPNIYIWNHIWGVGYVSGSWLPVKISNLKNLNISYEYKIEHSGVPLNFMNEWYITSNKLQTSWPQPGDIELLILWYHYLDFPPGNKLGSVTLPVEVNNENKNITFDVYSDNSLWTQTLVTFVPIDYNLTWASLSYNVADFVAYLKKYFPNLDNMYLEDWHMGSEFWWWVKNTKERFYIQNFKVDLNWKETIDESIVVSWTLNECFLPLFGVNGGIQTSSEITNSTGYFYGDMNRGLKIGCEERSDFFKDFCSYFDSNLIKNNQFRFSNEFRYQFNWWQLTNTDYQNFLNQFQSQFKFAFQFRFSSPKDLKYFYQIYCVDDNYSKLIDICLNGSTIQVPFYEVYSYLIKDASIWKCDATLSKLPGVLSYTGTISINNNINLCDVNSFWKSNRYNEMLVTQNDIPVQLEKWTEWISNWVHYANYYLVIKNNLIGNQKPYPLLDITDWFVSFNTSWEIIGYSNANLTHTGNTYIFSQVVNQNNIIFNWDKVKIWFQLKWDQNISNIQFRWLKFNIKNCADGIQDYGEIVVDGGGPICRTAILSLPNIVKNNPSLKLIKVITNLSDNGYKISFNLKNDSSLSIDLWSDFIFPDAIKFIVKKWDIMSSWGNIDYDSSSNIYNLYVPSWFQYKVLWAGSFIGMGGVYIKFSQNECDGKNWIKPINSETVTKEVIKLPSYISLDTWESIIILHFAKSYYMWR